MLSSFVLISYIALQDMKTKKKTGKKYVHLACDVPPDKSKHLLLINVIYENDGSFAGNVWVPTINHLCQKF